MKCLVHKHQAVKVNVVSNVCMASIDYTVLTGIAVVAAARYFGRARESFRDDLNNSLTNDG